LAYSYEDTLTETIAIKFISSNTYGGDMPYRVLLTENFLKELERVDEKTREEVFRVVRDLEWDVHRGKELSGYIRVKLPCGEVELKLWVVNVGDYRLYRIVDEKELTTYVISLRPKRKETSSPS